MSNRFLNLLEERILVFDGAMGTSIQLRDLTLDDYQGLEGCSEILAVSRPDVIREIHASFLTVGCHAIETNTFGANRVVFAEYGIADRVYEINKAASELARNVAADFSTASEPRWVIGSMGPGTRLPSLGHIFFDDLAAMYEEQAHGLIDGSCDVLLIETCQDILQAKAAIVGTQRALRAAEKSLPILVQVTIETTGAMLIGTEINAALTILEPYDIDVIGMNCATGPAEMNDAVRYLGDNCVKSISCLPNAGLPTNEGGKAVYHLTPEDFADALKQYVVDYGVNIVGGCCGTTPEHLRQLIGAVGGLSPKRREVPVVPAVASCYSSIPLRQEPPPTIVAEKMNATTQSDLFRKMVIEEQYDEMLSLAKSLANEGSHALDVCVAIVGENEKKNMGNVISKLATRVTVPLVIDSTEADAIEEALKHIPGKPIINSINMEDGEKRMADVCPLVKGFGAAVIALTIDEDGMALTAEKKFAIAQRIFDLATSKYGIRPCEIIFDPLVLPISTGQEEYRTAGIETLKAISLIKERLPECLTNLGVSNVSFGLKPHARRILNSVFLHEAVERGLDMAIVNYERIYPLYKISDEEVELARKLIEHDTSDGDPLVNFMNFYQSGDEKAYEVARRSDVALTVEERLRQMLINGEKVTYIDGQQVGLEEVLRQALAKYSPLDIINTILLDGMKVVGELFGSGKMQLPSVLDAAQVMKSSVTFLEPFMEKADSANRGTVVIATVKGDVHDIGKNLVDIILTNNGYHVVNLGIKQPSDAIIAAALEHKVDAIGLSGLLVKSTVEMKYVLEDLTHRGLSFPVLCGGAALTRRYVERDLRGIYRHGVYYGEDAFAGLHTMDALQDPKTREGKLEEGRTIVSDEPVRKLGTKDESVQLTHIRQRVRRDIKIPKPPFWGTRIWTDMDLREVFPYINPVALFKNQWQIRGLSKQEYKRQVEEKFEPTRQELQEEVIREGYFTPRVVYGYFPCQSERDDLIVYDLDGKTERTRFHFPRQQDRSMSCIADYFIPVESCSLDVVALQLVTIGERATEVCQQLFHSNQYTKYLYLHGLSVETAEALAEYVHKKIREELGIADEDSPNIEEIFRQGYRGKRYSFGYGACPNLEDQEKLMDLLDGERAIGVRLTTGYQLDPEQSTTALVVHHPEARYFNV